MNKEHRDLNDVCHRLDRLSIQLNEVLVLLAEIVNPPPPPPNPDITADGETIATSQKG